MGFTKRQFNNMQKRREKREREEYHYWKDPEYKKLLAAAHVRPDDALPIYILADWLDEHVRVCNECRGTLIMTYKLYDDSRKLRTHRKKCVCCKGTGTNLAGYIAADLRKKAELIANGQWDEHTSMELL